MLRTSLHRVRVTSLSGSPSFSTSSTARLLRGPGNFNGHSSSFSTLSSASSSTFFRYSSLAALSLYFTSSSNCEQHFLSHTQPPPPPLHIAPLPSPLPLPQTVEQIETTFQTVKRVVYSLWKYLKRIFYASKRITECSLVIGAAVVIAPPALYFGKEEFLWQHIVDSIQYLGPTFIKLAQWASSRPDLFP
jgi:hypothetical protein